MSLITRNPVNFHRYKNNNSFVKSGSSSTSDSKTTTKSIANTKNDTVKLSPKNASSSTFIKILNEVSSKSKSVKYCNGSISAGLAFMLSYKKMTSQSWYGNSPSNYFSNYSDLIDNVNNFHSSNNGNSNNFSRFCNAFKEHLTQYGIS